METNDNLAIINGRIIEIEDSSVFLGTVEGKPFYFVRTLNNKANSTVKTRWSKEGIQALFDLLFIEGFTPSSNLDWENKTFVRHNDSMWVLADHLESEIAIAVKDLQETVQETTPTQKPIIKQIPCPSWALSMVSNYRQELAQTKITSVVSIATKTDDQIFSAREEFRGMNQDDILLSMIDWLNGDYDEV